MQLGENNKRSSATENRRSWDARTYPYFLVALGKSGVIRVAELIKKRPYVSATKWDEIESGKRMMLFILDKIRPFKERTETNLNQGWKSPSLINSSVKCDGNFSRQGAEEGKHKNQKFPASGRGVKSYSATSRYFLGGSAPFFLQNEANSSRATQIMDCFCFGVSLTIDCSQQNKRVRVRWSASFQWGFFTENWMG